MTCQVWGELASLGDELLRDGSCERARAEDHFEQCPSCAQRAFLLDPSWAMRDLPEVEIGAGELAQLERNLAAAGHIRDVESAARGRRKRNLAVAACAAVLIAIGVGIATRGSLSPVARTEVFEESVSAPMPWATALTPHRAPGDPDLSVPAIRTLTPAAARVYDLGQEDFALVMVVHETLDL